MEKKTLKRIFEFLEEKEQHNPPFMWKHKNNIPLTEEELIVKGNLNLEYSKITSLPEGLKVGGTLRLGFTNIASLPEGLKVGGHLNLHSCEKLTSLPKGLKVGGCLDLRGTTITSLPKGLEVGGYLYIYATNLAKYTNEELREMIYPGFIKGVISR
jgi:hypothetical protein